MLLLVVPSRNVYVSAKLTMENYKNLDAKRIMLEGILGSRLSLNDALSLILYYIDKEVESGVFKSKLIKLLLDAKTRSVSKPVG